LDEALEVLNISSVTDAPAAMCTVADEIMDHFLDPATTYKYTDACGVIHSHLLTTPLEGPADLLGKHEINTMADLLAMQVWWIEGLWRGARSMTEFAEAAGEFRGIVDYVEAGIFREGNSSTEGLDCNS